MKRFFFLIPIISFLACPCIGFAEERIAKTFYNNLKTDLKLQFFIIGVGEASNYINGILEDKGQDKLYCQPNIKLSLENYIQIYKDTYDVYDGDSFPKAMLPQHVLIKGLQRTFPCN